MQIIKKYTVKNKMEQSKFELGEWVGTESGYGQIMYIRAYYVEDYDNSIEKKKKGSFLKFIYICKILCDLNGKIINKRRIKVFTSIEKIDNIGEEFVQKIKNVHPEDYTKYILYDEKYNITNQIFRSYKIDNYSSFKNLISNVILKVNNNLYPSFTYKEFIKEVNNEFNILNIDIDFENIISFGDDDRESLTLRFDSQLYKTKGKEVVFDNVVFIS